MKPTTRTIAFFLCPACKKHEFTVDHLREMASPAEYGWACDCGKKVWFTWTDGDIVVTRVEENAKPVLDVLYYREDQRLRLIVKGRRYGGGDSDGSYWYNEHTCPSNWMRDVVGVVFEKDTDPHGVFKLGMTLDVPNAHERETLDAILAEINGSAERKLLPKLTAPKS